MPDHIKFDPRELKEYIIDELTEWAQSFLMRAMRVYKHRPHWKKRLDKNLKKSLCLLHFAHSNAVGNLLEDACKHFENTWSRAYNILLPEVYVCVLGGKKKAHLKSRWFHYYLSIRIRKIKVQLLTGEKVLAYSCRVEKICPMGQHIHRKLYSRQLGFI